MKNESHEGHTGDHPVCSSLPGLRSVCSTLCLGCFLRLECVTSPSPSDLFLISTFPALSHFPRLSGVFITLQIFPDSSGCDLPSHRTPKAVTSSHSTSCP